MPDNASATDDNLRPVRLPGRRKHKSTKLSSSQQADAEPESGGSVKGCAGLHSADGPIAHPDDDELGRKDFARALAADVRHAPKASGFVIGLAGPWGCGKTSLLKLAGHELRDDVSAVVVFNPWLFSGAEQLVTHFFAELAGQLEQSGRDRLNQIAGGLSVYGRLVSPLRYAPFVGGIAGLTSDAAGALGESLRSEDLSAEVQAQRIRADLLELEKPILVLVDDLDRLRPEEIVDVIRLIRLVGDFPNLVYIVAFDQAIVETALNGNGGDGQAYLEKIIHVPHTVPSVRHEDLTRVLQVALAEAIPNPTELRFEEQRFSSLFWEDVRPLFETVRDVRRFINAIRTSLELLGDEVDLADLLALEALRLFEPDAFAKTIEARYLLTGSGNPLDGGYARLFASRTEADDEAQVKAIVETSSDRDQIERIITQLFPLAEKHFGGSLYDRSFKSEWKTKRRVAIGEVFDVYLHRRLAPGALPTREVEAMLKLFADKTALIEAVQRLDDEILRGLYMRLGDYEGTWSASEVRNAMEVVMHRGVGFGDAFEDMSGSILMRRLLKSVPADEVSSVLRELNYPDRSRQFEIWRAASYRGDRHQGMLSEDEAAALGREFRSELLAGSGGDFLEEPDFAPLLGFLEDEDRDRLLSRLPEWVSNDIFLVRFVAAHSFSKVGERNQRAVQLDWPTLRGVLSAADCLDRIKEVDSSWVETNFDTETTFLWQQARRYADHHEEAAEDLVGWPSRERSDESTGE
ncbi:MAG TPA: P-loop NTPase fold protein [Solirubrobacterales bacterium]|nr:P-loop NTPase fold protein [Solirubrobacterales bacterium]